MLIVLGVLSYVTWCGAAWLLQDRFLFPGAGGFDLAKTPANTEIVWLEHDDGTKVEGWFLPGAGRSRESPGPALIYAHGNGEIIDLWPPRLAPYRKMGISILLIEYRGYGRSTGTPSQLAIVEDSQRFYDWLAARPEVDAARIALHGRSLGGGVVAALSALRPPAAVILESTFTSITAMFWRFGVPSLVCANPFRSDEALAALQRPVLIFHGTEDGVVPVAHGRELHRLIPGSEYVETRGGHNDFPPEPEKYWETIRQFLTRHAVLAE